MPVQDAENYLIVLSTSADVLHGFDPVVKTNTTSVPVSGTVVGQGGTTWNFSGTADVTTTTTTESAFTIQSRTIYATAFDLRGIIVTQRWHTYSTKQGGDPANSFGHNLGNTLRSINARGRLIDSVVKDIANKN